jgi:hypothetical protein
MESCTTSSSNKKRSSTHQGATTLNLNSFLSLEKLYKPILGQGQSKSAEPLIIEGVPAYKTNNFKKSFLAQ